MSSGRTPSTTCLPLYGSKASRPVRGHLELEGPAVEGQVFAVAGDRNVEKVHGRAADKAGHKDVAWLVVQGLRGIALLQNTIAHDGDAGTHGHGLNLVMGHIDEGGLKALMQARRAQRGWPHAAWHPGWRAAHP